jgi:hypothetical protein
MFATQVTKLSEPEPYINGTSSAPVPIILLHGLYSGSATKHLIQGGIKNMSSRTHI